MEILDIPAGRCKARAKHLAVRCTARPEIVSCCLNCSVSLPIKVNVALLPPASCHNSDPKSILGGFLPTVGSTVNKKKIIGQLFLFPFLLFGCY